jgi:tryptophan-rich sensory protein
MARVFFFFVVFGHALLALVGVRLMLPGLTAWYAPLARAEEAPPVWLLVLGWLAAQGLAALSCLEFAGHARGSAHFWPAMRLYLAHALLGLAWWHLFAGQGVLGPAVLAGAVLAGSVALLIMLTRVSSYRAALLMLPVFLWAIFLTGLAHALFQLQG